MTDLHQPVHIAIIGGGFCGTMTAVHLLKDQQMPIHIHLINKGYPLTRGVAYDPHTASLLLNVPDGRMSAFPDLPGHYVQWLKKNADPDDHSFSPRGQYGRYLNEVWEETVKQLPEHQKITVYHDYADDISPNNGRWNVCLREHPVLTVDTVVLATGNELPRFPGGLDASFKNSNYYFADPWKKGCIENLGDTNDVLIIGNGLTMADTVIALKEKGFKQTIHTISPNGFRLKPWEESKEPYTGIDLPAVLDRALFIQQISLLDLLGTLNRHRKMAARLNQSFYPVIDAIRPYTERLWQHLDKQDKRRFLKRLGSLWGTVRHRLPLKSMEIITALLTDELLFTHAGALVSSKELQDGLSVTLNCGGSLKELTVQRIINCSGPDTHIKNGGNPLLKNMEKRGLICADPYGLGVFANPENGNITDADQVPRPGLFVAGSNLKGMLLETTAVPELSVQTQKLARYLLSTISAERLQFAEGKQGIAEFGH